MKSRTGYKITLYLFIGLTLLSYVITVITLVYLIIKYFIL